MNRRERDRRRAIARTVFIALGTYALGNVYPASRFLPTGQAAPRPAPRPAENPKPIVEPTASAAVAPVKPASPVVETVIVEVTREASPIPFSARAFEDKDANEIAEAKGISVGDFFKFRLETLGKLQAFKGPDLFPIYPPSVMKWKKLIYDLAKESKLPPNVVATVMSIESNGIQAIGSNANAQGLFQVLPLHFPDDIKNNPAEMQKPEVNGRVGMNFFANECLPAARREITGKGDDHVNVYAKAMACYNAGASVAPFKFDDLPEETKYYGDHFVRFAMTAEIAEGLRRNGFTDSEIIDKLSSRNFDSRSFAFQQFRIARNGNYSYATHEQALVELSKPGNVIYFVPNMVKFKNYWISLSAVNTRMSFQILIYVGPYFDSNSFISYSCFI